MTTILNELRDNKLIDAPSFVIDNLVLLTRGGSYAYGCNTSDSDCDLIGICIPQYDLENTIFGFDDFNVFNEFQHHHIHYNDEEYDVRIYGLPRLFDLASQGNPNILDIISTKDFAVLYENEIGKSIRDNRSIFFSKDCVGRFLGFSDNHFKSISNRIKFGNFQDSRRHLYEKYGYDVKDASHCIRALFSIKDILLTGEYEIDKYKNIISGIRNGKYSYEEVLELRTKLREDILELEKLSSIQDTVDINKVRQLLLTLLGK